MDGRAIQPAPVSVHELTQQLRELGVIPGGVLLVHCAFSRVKPIKNGPEGLIAALQTAVGPAGTLVMPTWVSPQQLRDAVVRLREAVQSGAPEARTILASYERNANRIESVAEEFMRDLQDTEVLTRWAEAEGATRMTLEVNW